MNYAKFSCFENKVNITNISNDIVQLSTDLETDAENWIHDNIGKNNFAQTLYTDKKISEYEGYVLKFARRKNCEVAEVAEVADDTAAADDTVVADDTAADESEVATVTTIDEDNIEIYDNLMEQINLFYVETQTVDGWFTSEKQREIKYIGYFGIEEVVVNIQTSEEHKVVAPVKLEVFHSELGTQIKPNFDDVLKELSKKIANLTSEAADNVTKEITGDNFSRGTTY